MNRAMALTLPAFRRRAISILASAEGRGHIERNHAPFDHLKYRFVVNIIVGIVWTDHVNRDVALACRLDDGIDHALVDLPAP
jgi:hypothetical protein